MNIPQWQARIRDQLTQSKELISRLTPGMTYGALATATLLPVIMAVKGGDITALMGVYTLLGNVGTGLVTNLIQTWKDREEAETVAELPVTIAEQVAEDDEAQATFDKLINTLETVRLTLESQTLPDPAAFVTALREELADLGSSVTISGDLINAYVGEYAQNVAIGKNVTQTINNYQTPPDPSKPDPAQLRRAYLNWVYQQSDMLSLSGVDPKAKSGEAHLSLGAVYTALLTMTPEDHDRWLLTAESAQRKDGMTAREGRRLSAIELLNRHQHLVLLGDPGSGKSTLVNFVALCLAGEGLQKAAANLALLTAPLPVADENAEAEERERQPWQHGALLPVRVVLRDFAARGLPAPGVKATADHLWRFICAELPGDALGDYAPLLRNELQKQGGLLLLDGLDEVPDADQRRGQIKQAVEAFVALYHNCHMLVTSRTYAYQQQEWRLRGFTETILAPFTDSQIRHFVDRWYAHIATVRSLDHNDAQGRAELLKRAIFAAPRLHDLAERPLLLTLTASIHAWRGGTLPDRREELYDAAVELLLDWWESQRVVRDEQGNLLVVQPSLVEWLNADRAAIRRVLNRLAFAAHQGQPRLVGTADITEKELVYALYEVRGDQAVSEEKLIEYLSERAGLLVPRGVKVYTFPHRTFQEYLAACHLTDDEYPAQVAELVRDEPNRWREVALLAGAKAVRGTASAIWSLVDALAYRQPDEANYTVADVWGAHLAGQALLESTNLAKLSERNQRRVDHVRTCLRHALRNPEFPASERAAAGRTLAKLGDSRVEVLDPLQMAWCEVPAGPFIMGSEDGDNDEKPQYIFDIPYTYHIARYPVTNAQFHCFVDDGGSAHKPYWVEAASHGRWKDGQLRNRTEPDAYGEPFNLPNHPVVGITWYEALAFSRWLTEQLHAAGQLAADWIVRLPTEAEWEKAARGDEGQRYPWPGDQADPNRANYKDTGIGTTSAVGAFPGGRTPYGAEEMAGNVEEWCSTAWLDNYEDYANRVDDSLAEDTLRVVRGGSFGFYDDYARATYRFGYLPDYRYFDVGVRFLLSPSLL